jgi:hypothetical protein
MAIFSHTHTVDRATDVALNPFMIALAQLCPEMGVDVPVGGQSHQKPRSMTFHTKGRKYVVSSATSPTTVKVSVLLKLSVLRSTQRM